MSNIINYEEIQVKYQHSGETEPRSGTPRDFRRKSCGIRSSNILESNIIIVEDVSRILSCLTPIQREVAIMKADGASTQEIAVELKITPAQVNAVLKSARDNIVRLAPDIAS